MLLSSKELSVIMSALESKYGGGYNNAEENGVKIGQLQAKLSIMAEMAAKTDR